MARNIGRNDPCPCGSGRKYKKCCLQRNEEKQRSHIEEKPVINRKNIYNKHDFDDLNRTTPSSYVQDSFEEDKEYPRNNHLAENYICRQFDKEIPRIGDDQQKLVDDWYLQYKQIQRKAESNSSLIKEHIVRFLDRHPHLAINLSLDDAIFSLETSYLKYGNYVEFIDFLQWYGVNFRSAYDLAAPYFDYYLIAYKLVQREKEDIPELFSFFKTYPDEQADCLSWVVDLLKAADEEDLLLNLLGDIYLQVFYSPKLIRGHEFVAPILAHTYGKHLKKDCKDINVDALIEDVKHLSDKVPCMGIYTSREYWKKFLEEMYVKIPSVDFPSDRDGIESYYRNIDLRFRLFLHSAKKKTWIGADHLSGCVGDFLMMPIWENKRPKTPFKFTSDLIEKHILGEYRDILGIKSINAISFLQALYYFAEYLQVECRYSLDDRKNLEEICISLFRRIYDSYASTEYGVRIFQSFPACCSVTKENLIQ